jgi:hypothetical protein
MKRFTILLGALCAAALMLVFCTTVEFDNPLDKKGDNYLFGIVDEEKHKTQTDANGIANIFNTDTVNKYWGCDKVAPTLAIKGPQTVTIYHDEPLEFQKWMGLAGSFSDILEWSSGVGGTEPVSIRPARLTTGGENDVTYSGNMPPNGNYTIVYTAVKTPNCSDGFVPSPATAQRGLIIEQREVVVNDPPTVTLRGQNPFQVVQHTTYVDPGAFATDGDGRTDIPITKIEVRNSDGGIAQTIVPPASHTDINTVSTTLVGRKYSITYYTESRLNDKTDSKTREVEVVSEQDTRLPVPIIVLNMYSHRFLDSSLPGGDITFNHPDTSIPLYGGNYVEKGVERVYFTNNNQQSETVCVGAACNGLVTIAQQGTTLRAYRIERNPTGGYDAATTTRTVHTYDGDCDDKTPPTINLIGSDPLILSIAAHSNGWSSSANTVWTVTGNDELKSGFRYLTHGGSLVMLPVVPGITPSNTFRLELGSHTVTHVARGGCGGITVRQRTITVNP